MFAESEIIYSQVVTGPRIWHYSTRKIFALSLRLGGGGGVEVSSLRQHVKCDTQCCQHLLTRNPKIKFYEENSGKCIGLMGTES